MEVEIRCESCRVLLRVPCEAAGHRARCRSCGHEFLVPKMDALLEDTVSEWIERDVEEVFEHRGREVEEQLRRDRERRERLEAQAPSVQAPERPKPPDGDGHAHDEHDHHADADRHGRDDASSDKRRSRRLWPMRATSRPSLPGGVMLPDASHSPPASDPHLGPAPPGSLHRGADAARPLGTHGADEASGGVPRRSHASSSDSGQPHRYPDNLQVDEQVPHLIIKKVDAAGVRFAFDSIWLGHEGFRASMPARCVFSGSTTREKLIARPLVFMDRATAAAPTIDRINSAHENRQLSDHPPRHIMRMMGLIEGLPQPFSYAMPYYVSNGCSHLPLHCQTRDRTTGGITCEVLIPDGLTALDWLARVNGVCGREYELLEHDVGLRHGDAWAQLSEECRQRIATWCKLDPHEMLQHYFPDADFGKRDEGLAGIVLTDQRLVFSKYHHRGQVRLDHGNASVLARGEGRFVSLSLRVGNEIHRMIKLHRHDLDRLTQALQQAGTVQLQAMQEA